MRDTELEYQTSASNPGGRRLPSQTARVVRSAKRMQWALVVVAVANIAALIMDYQLNRVVVSQYTPMLDGVLHIKQNVIRSHLWLRENDASDDPDGLDQILWHLEQAQAIVENVIEGRQVHLLPLADRPDDEMKAQWTLLLEKIWRLQARAVAADTAEQHPEQIRRATARYDEAVRDVISFADLIEAQLETRISEHLTWLQRLHVVGIGFFILLVAVGAFILRRGFQQLLQEIHRRCRAEGRLERSRKQAIVARDELAEAIAAKDQFLGKVSHEVRNLTNTIFGLATMIESPQPDAVRHNYVRMLETETDTLQRLMEDLLELSKLKSHRLCINPVAFELRQLVADAVDLCVAEADARGLLLDVDLPLDFPESLVGDPARIRQVLVNLLKNAIKFTDEGTVVAGLRCVRIVDARCDVEIWVSDTGMGIPDDRRENIFDPFDQAEKTTTQRFGGTGLGLAICRELVVLMGGGIRVEDVAGGGSRFIVSLPMQLHEGADASPAVLRLDGIRLLVVDLSDDVRERTCRLLRDSGATLRTADSGAQAMRELETSSAEQGSYAAVIVSDRLADVDLGKFIRRLRTEQRLDAVVTSGRLTDVDMGQFVRRLRAGQHLKKMRVVAIRRSSIYVNAADTTKDELTEQIAAPYRVLKLPWLLLHGHAAAPAATEDERQDIAINTGLDVLLVDDHPVMQIAGRHMLESIGCRVDSAHDGTSALRQWGAKHYDVVFLDGEMPDIGGLEVARRIRSRESEASRPRTYIVGIAANAITCSRERCLEADMDEYIGKPVTKESCVRVLQRFSASRDAATDSAPKERPSPAQLAAATGQPAAGPLKP